MKVQAVHWLPAASRVDLEKLMQALVEQWLDDWVLDAGTIDVAIVLSAARATAGWRGTRNCRLRADEADTVALGFAACTGRADNSNLADRSLLEHVGSDMLEDLLVRVGAGLSKTGMTGRADAFVDHREPDGAKHRFCVTSSSDEWSLLLVLDESTLVQLRKAVAGSSRTPVLAPLSVALAGENVRLGCHLGSAEITVADLSTLAIGDVLVFSQRVEAPVSLTIDGAIPRTGEARIGAQGDTIQITIASPIHLLQET